jgi:hypothetical protein
VTGAANRSISSSRDRRSAAPPAPDEVEHPCLAHNWT